MSQKNLLLTVFVILMLALAACSRAEELDADIEMQYVIVGQNDHYTSDETKSFVRMSSGLAAGVDGLGGYERATDANDANIRAAGVPVGRLIGYDEGVGVGKRYEELKVVDENANVVIQLSQSESGLVNNSENLQVYYGGSILAQMFERENVGEDEEVESIEYLEDGRWVGVAEVSERGVGLAREALRDGTTITDYRAGETWVFETDFNRTVGLLIPTGSKIYVNGEHVLNVETRVLESRIGRKIFDGFSIQDPAGQELCGYRIADELSKRSFAYEFSCGEQKLGVLFVQVNQDTVRRRPDGERCASNDGCTQTTIKVSYQLAGETTAEKVENLLIIDYIMALMPDQVNKNSNDLHELEEMTDVVILLVLEPQGMDAVKYGISLAQEEDALLVREAYDYIIGHYESVAGG